MLEKVSQTGHIVERLGEIILLMSTTLICIPGRRDIVSTEEFPLMDRKERFWRFPL